MRRLPPPVRLVPLIAALLVASPRARAAAPSGMWTLTQADFSSRPVSLSGLNADGVTIAAPDGDAPQSLRWDDVLELDRSEGSPSPLSTAAAADSPFTLYLAGGDRVAGRPVATAGETLTWANGLVGELPVPLTRAAAIARGVRPPEGIDEARAQDVVRFVNGDAVTGIISAISADAVSIQAGDANSSIPLANVATVLFATAANTAKPQRSFRVTLRDGSSVAAPAVSLDGGRLALQFDAKTGRAVDLDAVVGVEQLNGPVTWVTGLTPTASVYRPFLAEQFPPRVDRTTDGVPIRERFRTARHGIGCHSYTRLTYALDGAGAAAFRAQYVVDSDSPLANVTVRILLDDKVAYEAADVTGGKTSPVVVLPLGGAKTLSLEVDYGRNYATEDRFAWLDPALLKVMPPTPATLPATAPTTAPSDEH